MNRYNRDQNGTEANSTIGIVGFGHLGHSLALPLVKNGFPKEQLLISHRGCEATHRRAREAGLGDCLTNTEDLMNRADTIIVAVRPQDVPSLSGIAVKPAALLISCMAGLPLDLLRAVFGGDVRRIMCSGPDTILERRGIATLYPTDARVSGVLERLGLKILRATSEGELDSFTAGICLPAILLNIRVAKKEIREAMEEMRKIYPVYGALRDWVSEVTPRDGDTERGAYLENVSTKGGISEAMTESLQSGGTLLTALRRGLERGREITDSIREEILESLELAG